LRAWLRRGPALTSGALARAATLPGMEIDTGSGPARAELDEPASPSFLMVLTHGAGGGVDSPDLLAAAQAAVGLGGAVARVLQPYRVRGARAPGSAERQDAAWLEIIEGLRARFPGIPLVQGGRSNGARVACRTASAAGATAVVALAFPLHPPGRPERSRAAELRQAGTPVLVVNGDRDPFGIPDGADASLVAVLPGETHALSRHPGNVRQAVHAWLGEVLGSANGRGSG
jgi:predicted alpha/beta-hydrolase family hydrolase